jgi:transposase
MPLDLNCSDREELERRCRSQSLRAGDVRKARLLLLLAEGRSYSEISPGRLERHGFEYFRHGTLSLYAALDTKTGSVLGRTADSHTSEEFVSFLAELVASQPEGKEIHVILDNLSAHKSKRVKEFLSLHLQVHFHFTPTYSSWLNQVELWFAKIERDVIARGVFNSSRISPKNSFATSATTIAKPSPSSGSTLILHGGSETLPFPRRQATRSPQLRIP